VGTVKLYCLSGSSEAPAQVKQQPTLLYGYLDSKTIQNVSVLLLLPCALLIR